MSALVIAEQLGYCDGEQLEWVRNLKDSIEKNLNGCCRSIRRQEQGIQDLGTHYLAEDPVRYNYYDHNYYDYDDDITAHSVPNRESPIAAQPNTDRPE